MLLTSQIRDDEVTAEISRSMENLVKGEIVQMSPNASKAACDKASSSVISDVLIFRISMLLSYAPLRPLPNWPVMAPEMFPPLLFSRL